MNLTLDRPATAPVNRTPWFQATKIKPRTNLTLRYNFFFFEIRFEKFRISNSVKILLFTIFNSFEAIRIEAKKPLCDCVPYFITYYCEDDTISVKERKQRDESYDFCPFLIKRVKVPKYCKRLINSLIVAEDGDARDSNNVQQEFLQPADIAVGKEVNLLGHRFLIRDCDAKTRKYYEEILKMNQGERVSVDQNAIRPTRMQEVRLLE